MRFMTNQNNHLYKHWYIVCYRGVKPTATPLYDELKAYFSEDELCWPMKVVTVNERKNLRPVLPRNIFVNTTKEKLQQIFLDAYVRQQGYVASRIGSEDANDYAVVPDVEITRFKWFVENQSDSLVELHKKYSELQKNTKVRVTEGMFKGMEGVIFRHHGDRRFAFNVGSLAIVVSDVMKWSMEVIGDNLKMIEGYSIYHEIDSLQEKLRCLKDYAGRYPYYDSSADMLARMVLLKIDNAQLVKVKKGTIWSANDIKDVETVKTVIDALSKEEKLRLDAVVTYVAANYQHILKTNEIPDIESLFCLSPLRPFMTLTGTPTAGEVEYSIDKHPDFIELTHEIKVDEEDVANKYGVHNYYKSSYYAHVALFAQDGGVLAITNWNSCADACMKKAADGTARLPLLKKIAGETNKQKVCFVTHGNIKGTAVFVPDIKLDVSVPVTEIAKTILPAANDSVKMLINESVALCNEIWHGTYPGLRQELMKVWIKAVPADTNACSLPLDRTALKKTLLKYLCKIERASEQFCIIRFCNYLLATYCDERYEKQYYSYRLITDTDFNMIKKVITDVSKAKKLPKVKSWHNVDGSNIAQPIF